MASTTVTAKTVLVADDTAFVRDRFRAALENAGHKAIVVKSAAELLARIKTDLTSIDLVVLDLRLPYAPGVAGTSTNTAPDSTFCRPWRRTCFPTTSIAAADPARSSGSRCSIASAT